MSCKCTKPYTIRVEKVTQAQDIVLSKGTSGSAGIDLQVDLSRGCKKRTFVRKDKYSDLEIVWEDVEPSETITIRPGESYWFKTGFKTEFSSNLVMEIYPRSSTGINRQLMLNNTVGIIDSDYRGEIMAFVENTSTVRNITIKHAERLFQILFRKLPDVELVMVDNLNPTERGEGGYGSTGQ